MKGKFLPFLNRPVSRKYSFTLLFLFIVGCVFTACRIGQNAVALHPSTPFKVRALWVGPPGFVNREIVDQLIVKCKRAGINMIIPDIMFEDTVYFKSENFIGTVRADDNYDPLAYLIEQAHLAGIEVHPWSCVYYTKPKSPEWVSVPLVSKDYHHQFLSPAHPEVTPYLISVLQELLKYDIDGIHLDYTRYWNAAFDYSETARRIFNELYGFDPQNFIDHPEKIVPVKSDPYPVRVLCHETMRENVAQLGTIERTMTRTEVGYALVSDNIENIDQLRTPGMLIVSHYSNVSHGMIDAFKRYAERGGDIVWVNPDPSLFQKCPELEQLSGVTELRYLKHGPGRLFPDENQICHSFFQPFVVNTLWNRIVTGKGEVIATIENGGPVASVCRRGNGSVAIMAFRLMESENPQMMKFFSDLIMTYRQRAGVNGPDLMAEKRREWTEWRASHILDLVRKVSAMVKAKDSRLQVSAAAGVGPQQYYGVYRDGAQWLKENFCDFIFPMNYTDNIDELRDILDEQHSFTPENLSHRIYPGLRLYQVKQGKYGPITGSLLQSELEMIQEDGYEGFCLFSFSFFTDEIVHILRNFSK